MAGWSFDNAIDTRISSKDRIRSIKCVLCIHSIFYDTKIILIELLFRYYSTIYNIYHRHNVVNDTFGRLDEQSTDAIRVVGSISAQVKYLYVLQIVLLWLFVNVDFFFFFFLIVCLSTHPG